MCLFTFIAQDKVKNIMNSVKIQIVEISPGLHFLKWLLRFPIFLQIRAGCPGRPPRRHSSFILGPFVGTGLALSTVSQSVDLNTKILILTFSTVVHNIISNFSVVVVIVCEINGMKNKVRSLKIRQHLAFPSAKKRYGNYTKL